MVALGGPAGVAAALVREVVPGRGTPLLSFIEEALASAGATMADIEAIGVGPGPRSFTGLRAGLATAKTLCWTRRLPLVGLPTDVTIRRAAALVEPSLAAPVAVVLPAGARDHYVSLVGEDPRLGQPAADLVALTGGAPVAGVDLDPAAVRVLIDDLVTRGLPDPVALGAAAVARGPEALLACMDERIAAELIEDPATLVPRYVALPRGIAAVPVELGTTVTDTTRQGAAWSPTRP
jgi:tRNA threonylcarbamoyl adenosine modification protein YeaZ